nr:hypothetical protein [Leptospira interrogans]
MIRCKKKLLKIRIPTILEFVLTTRTPENNTKLLTGEFAKKIEVFKKYRKFGIYGIFRVRPKHLNF